MSSEKLAIYLVLGIVIIVAIVFGVYMLFFRKKNGMSGAGSFDSVFKNANTNLKEPVKKLMSINDDQFSFFIAGVFSATCLSKDDFKKIFEMKEDNDEEKKKTKASLENLEKAKDSLVKFLGLKEESEIKKSIGEVDQLNLIKDYATEEKDADVSKKDSEPFKNIIENIKKTNNKESEALNKNLSDKKKYSMVEVVICGTTEIFKKCISASA